jgi:hypothetical protein
MPAFGIMDRNDIAPDRTPGWRDSRHICALWDGDRHLGYIVLKSGQWSCFDATHLNDAGDGFRHLGNFSGINIAKAVVEGSCAMESQVKRMWVF